VDLVEVDPIRAQPPQRVLDLADYPPARTAPLVRVVIGHRAVKLGGKDDRVAPAVGQRLAHDLLRLPARVDVGGVDEVDPRVERRVNDAHRLVVIGIAPGAEHHRTEAELGDRHAGATERAVLHEAYMPRVSLSLSPEGRSPAPRVSLEAQARTLRYRAAQKRWKTTGPFEDV
jgi:hypothetical protein